MDKENPIYTHIILFYHACIDDPSEVMNMRNILPNEIAQVDLNLVSDRERIKSSQESPSKKENDPTLPPQIKEAVVVDSASDVVEINCSLPEQELTNDNDNKIALDPAYEKLSQYQRTEGSTVIYNRHNENESEI